MHKVLTNQHFYRTFFVLTLSLALQNLLTYSVNLADNIMIGRYSQTAMSSVALCNQFQFLLQMLVSGISEGVVVLGAQYWGKNEYRPIRNIIGVGLRFGLGIAAILFVLAFFFPVPLLNIICNDSKVTAEAAKYLQIVSCTYLIFTASNALTSSLRCIGIVKIGYILSASTLCINIALNYCLIYGNLGFPEMGIRGAAIATLVSRTVELLIVAYYVKFKEHRLHLSIKALVQIDTSYVNDYVRVSLPLLVTQATWGVAQIVQTSIIGHLADSESAIAANAIAVLTFQIISVLGYGAAGAAGILTGKAVGRGDIPFLHQQTFTFQLLFLVFGLFTGASIWLSRDLVLSFYPTLTAAAQDVARDFIAVMAVTSVGTCYQMAADTGIIRAGGSPDFSMKNNFIFMWLLVLPASAIAAFVLHLPPVVVFVCLKSDQILKCPVVLWYTNSYRWIRNVTRTSICAKDN